MYLCVSRTYVCAFMQIASGEMMLCGLQLCPHSVGTWLSFHRYRSPGTRTDRQADGETVDERQLTAEVLKPAHSQGAIYWSLSPSFSTFTGSDPETPTWEELAVRGNSWAMSELQRNGADPQWEGFQLQCWGNVHGRQFNALTQPLWRCSRPTGEQPGRWIATIWTDRLLGCHM